MKNLLVIYLISFSCVSQTRKDDFKLIIEKVFILESVETFFLDKNPIYILENNELKKAKIRNLGSSFKILSESEIKKNKIEEYVVFQKIELEKNSAKIIFKCDYEGMVAEVNLKKENSDWIVIDQKVFEF
jgi:hypothetical protein